MCLQVEGSDRTEYAREASSEGAQVYEWIENNWGQAH